MYKKPGWNRLDQVLSWAEQVERATSSSDLHAAPCGQNSLFISDPGPTLLWDSPACKARTVNLWKAIAGRYASRTVVAGYDLLNEPSKPGDGTALVNLYRDIIAAVRTVDRNHVVFTEGATRGRRTSRCSTGALDSNQAYSFHQYLWATLDPVGATRRIQAVADRDNLPLWLGEFGRGQRLRHRQAGRPYSTPIPR